jgi:hypothetical protein
MMSDIVHKLNNYSSSIQTTKYLFCWPYKGQRVFVAGSFDNWEGRYEMIKNDYLVFYCFILLPNGGTYEYKFIVDGEWYYDINRPHIMSNINTVNNQIIIEKNIDCQQQKIGLESRTDILVHNSDSCCNSAKDDNEPTTIVHPITKPAVIDCPITTEPIKNDGLTCLGNIYFNLNYDHTNMEIEKFYVSINNYKVYRSKHCIKLDPKIKELLSDPISLSYFIKPIYIPDSGMIYDKSTIGEWLLTSDKDPLTGIKINKNEIEVIPALNYFLALLCLEEIGSDIYFHTPMGNIFDLLRIAVCIFNDQKLCQITDKISRVGRADHDIISLNLLDYVDQFTIKNEFVINFEINSISSRKSLFYPVTLEDILVRCPITRKFFDKMCNISDFGIFIHSLIKGRFSSSRSNTMSECNDMFDSKIEKKCIIQKWNDYFDHNHSQQNSTFALVEDFNNTRKVNYFDVDKLDVIDIFGIKYPNMGYLLQYKIFKKPTSINNKDRYLEVKSTEENIYQFYIKHKDNINIKISKELSEILSKSKISNFGPEFVKKREFYDFPSLLNSNDMIYGNDYSFLEISNLCLRNTDFKMFYFVGTKFNHVIFHKCSFSSCAFIGADMDKLLFINCTFQSSSFYKTKIPRMENILNI